MVLDPALDALELVARRVVLVQPGWLALGTGLFAVSQVVRTRAWFAIIRAACPAAQGIRARDVTSAYLAGAGLNGVLPARAGDAVKLWLLRRRAGDDAPWPALVATLVPEGLFEFVCGTLLVLWALTQGLLPLPPATAELPTLDVSLVLRHPLASALVLGVLLAAAVMLGRRVRPRVRAAAAAARAGLAILGDRRSYVIHVVSWQALSRVVRLGSLAAFLAAFGLPVTFATALLVMAAQGGGRIIPIAPVSAGLRLAMLTYGFAQLTGQPIDVARILTFTAGAGAVHLVVLLTLGGFALSRQLGASPIRALRIARRAAVAPAPTPTPTGDGVA